jgi:hypothetical protein
MSNIAADLIEITERELSELLSEHETETDPFWRDVLATWIAIDTEWLAEMHAVVFPPLPFTLPLGLPAPGPVWGVGR